MAKKLFIRTFGCQMNEYDSDKMADILRAAEGFESTDRPEDMRTLDLFRSVRPHLENSILGITRWNLHTIGYQFTVSLAGDRLDVAPFAEGTFGTVKNIEGAFDPKLFYGSESVQSLSIGFRLSWRLRGHRMGRYGGLLENEPGMADMHHDGML